ncbi:MAG: hypothetical protein CM1200mP29_17420 [Verrucomicrobiota bacterium]|nr:MAG: hypothetical protein CM1200mP29_17420 [Verrucomicrobiota bacterium]
MLCDICKEKEATVHLTQMVEGKTKKIDLCEDCSKAKGVDDPAGFSLADLFWDSGPRRRCKSPVPPLRNAPSADSARRISRRQAGSAARTATTISRRE